MPIDLSTWITRRHATDAIYQCPVCGAAFTDRTDLNTHAIEQHNGRGRSYRCPTCGQIFASGRRFRRHLDQSHERRAGTRQGRD